MGKRLKFKCWNCSRTYSLYKEVSEEQVLIAPCPYCNAEAVVDLKPYPKGKKSILRGEGNGEQISGNELQLPDILPTQKPE